MEADQSSVNDVNGRTKPNPATNFASMTAWHVAVRLALRLDLPQRWIEPQREKREGSKVKMKTHAPVRPCYQRRG